MHCMNHVSLMPDLMIVPSVKEAQIFDVVPVLQIIRTNLFLGGLIGTPKIFRQSPSGH